MPKFSAFLVSAPVNGKTFHVALNQRLPSPFLLIYGLFYGHGVTHDSVKETGLKFRHDIRGPRNVCA
jgi:hypothetical protein